MDLSSASTSTIREQDPLKQGLKHQYRAAVVSQSLIREQDPLKQGLKHGTTGADIQEALFASKIH